MSHILKFVGSDSGNVIWKGGAGHLMNNNNNGNGDSADNEDNESYSDNYLFGDENVNNVNNVNVVNNVIFDPSLQVGNGIIGGHSNLVFPNLNFSYQPPNISFSISELYNSDDVEDIIIIENTCFNENGFSCKHRIKLKMCDGIIFYDLLSKSTIHSLLQKFNYPLDVFPNSTLVTHIITVGFINPDLKEQIKIKNLEEGFQIQTHSKGKYLMEWTQHKPDVTMNAVVYKKVNENEFIYKKMKRTNDNNLNQSNYTFLLDINDDIDQCWINSLTLIGSNGKELPMKYIKDVELCVVTEDSLQGVCKWYGMLLKNDEKFKLANSIPLINYENNNLFLNVSSNMSISDVYLKFSKEELPEYPKSLKPIGRKAYHRLYYGPLTHTIDFMIDSFLVELRFCLINKYSSLKHLFPEDVIKTVTLKDENSEIIYDKLPFCLFSEDCIGRIVFSKYTDSIPMGKVFDGILEMSFEFHDDINPEDFLIVLCGIDYEMIDILIPWNGLDDNNDNSSVLYV